MKGKALAGNTAFRPLSAGLCAVTTAILFASYILIPPAGFILGLLAPFPVAVTRFRQGRAAALIVALGGTALLAVGFDVWIALLYLAQCGITSLLLPELLYCGFGGARSIAWTVALNLALYGVILLALIIGDGQTPHQLHAVAVKEIQGSVAQALQIYKQTNITGDDFELLKKSMTDAADLFVTIYPALVTVLLFAMAGCNLALLKRTAPALGFRVRIGRFSGYRNPEMLVWLLIVAGFAMLSAVPAVTVGALNVLIVLAVLYFLQGMAVIATMTARFSPGAMLRTAFYLLLIVQPYLAALIAAIGIFDLWGDFRTPRKQENL